MRGNWKVVREDCVLLIFFCGGGGGWFIHSPKSPIIFSVWLRKARSHAEMLIEKNDKSGMRRGRERMKGTRKMILIFH